MIAKNRNAWSKTHPNYLQEAKRRDLTCGVGEASTTQLASTSSNNLLTAESDSRICENALFHDGSWRQKSNWYVQEAKRRGLSCGVGGTTQTASVQVPKAKPKVTSAALTASQADMMTSRTKPCRLSAIRFYHSRAANNVFSAII